MNNGEYSYDVFTVDISSGVVDLEFEIEGNVITYLIGTPDIAIKLNASSNPSITIGEKDRIQLPLGLSFKKFFLTASGGSTITLMVSKPDLIVDAGRVSGVVTALDQKYQDFLLGRCYYAQDITTPGAAEYGFICVGIDVGVTDYSYILLDYLSGFINSASPSGIRIGPLDPLISLDKTNADIDFAKEGTRRDAVGTHGPTDIGAFNIERSAHSIDGDYDISYTLGYSQYDKFEKLFDPPIKLLPGQAYGVENQTTNIAIMCSFEYRLIP